MKKVILAISFLSACLTGTLAMAAEAPPPPAIIETWTCNYLPRQDMGDLMRARDYYQRQARRAEVDIGPAYLWSLAKGDLPFDLVWLAPHESMGDWADAMEAEASAKEVVRANARFDDVVDCTARLGTVRQVFAREEAQDNVGGTAFVSALACTLGEGVGPTDVADLHGHIGEVFGGLGDAAPNQSYSMSPITGSSDGPDMILFSVFDDPNGYADFISGLFSNESNASLGRHLDAVADCNIALWNSTQVLETPEG